MTMNDAPAVESPSSSMGFGDLDSIPADQLTTATTYLYRIAEDGRKLPPGSGREMYLAKYTGRLVDLDEVRERWGGGSYLVMVVQRGGMMLRRVTVNIDGPPRHDMPELPSLAPASEVDRVAAAVASAIAPALEQLASAVRVIAESKQAPPPPAVDPLALVREVMSVVRESAPQSAGASASELMKVLREGITMGREAESPTKSVGDAIAEVAPKALEALGNIGAAMASRQQPMRRAAAPARANPASPGAPVPSAAVVLEQSDAQGNAVAERVRWLVEHLDTMRASGADASKVADVLEDLLSEFEIKKLTGYVLESDGRLAVNTSAVLAELGQFFPPPAGLVSDDGQRWLADFLVRLAEPADEDEPNAEAPTS